MASNIRIKAIQGKARVDFIVFRYQCFDKTIDRYCIACS
jgi:hypothetical protein